MVLPASPIAGPAPWQRALAEVIRDPAELLQRLHLDPALLPAARRAAELFPLRVPREFVARMTPGDPDDPLLRQVLPLDLEHAAPAGFATDPVADHRARSGPGVLQKYHGRALLITTGACAVHCRYCFRRHYPYDQDNASRQAWRQAVAHLAGQDDVDEVILSGGDPLTLSDRRLTALTRQLDALPRLRRLRLHSRLPVVLPARVDAGLLDWLGSTRLQTVMVIHANHPRELDGDVATAAASLRGAGITMLNQSVLLRGVNDQVETLAELSERLFEIGVLPYYLHLLDPVLGAAHFDVAEDQARALHRALAARLPGYLVPRLAREQPGAAGKTILA